MSRLSVNVNKVATLRNARGGNVPNVLKMALDAERYGADGITVHPRPDERHIRYQDVLDLSASLSKEFNIEGYPNQKFLELVKKVKPDQVTLVPDPPGVLTSNAGWDLKKDLSFVKEVIASLKEEGMRVSIFMETDLSQIELAKESGTDRIELYTGPYAEQFESDPEKALAPFKAAAELSAELNLGLNAGHDLNLSNLAAFKKAVPNLLEVSIGHALIADALYLGLENTIQLYQRQLNHTD